MVAEFKSEIAKKVLLAHEPGVRIFALSEIDLESNAINAALVDEAYKELIELGYVDEVRKQTFTVYAGGKPRHPFLLTEHGNAARDELIALQESHGTNSHE